jgi:hypothetical protein
MPKFLVEVTFRQETAKHGFVTIQAATEADAYRLVRRTPEDKLLENLRFSATNEQELSFDPEDTVVISENSRYLENWSLDPAFQKFWKAPATLKAPHKKAARKPVVAK